VIYREPNLQDRGHLLTEQRNKRTLALDSLSIADAFDVMNVEDQSIPRAVAAAKADIVKAVKIVSAAWQSGGRLIYVGAGTSGRLGVLDASECPPTFRSDPKMVRGIIAGGKKALWRSVEGAEDDPKAAEREIRKMMIGKRDVVRGDDAVCACGAGRSETAGGPDHFLRLCAEVAGEGEG
jgi:N-acetylmuramic acid 6-phosphate etherase